MIEKNKYYYFNFEGEWWLNGLGSYCFWPGLKGAHILGDIRENLILALNVKYVIDVYECKYGGWLLSYPMEIILKLIDEGKITQLTAYDLLIKDIIE